MRSRPRPPSLYSQKPRSEPTASPHCLRFAVPLRLPDQRIHGRLGQALHPGLPALKGTGVGALAVGLASRSSQPARTGGPAGGLPGIASLRGGLSVRCHPRSRAADPGPSPGSGRMASPLLLLRPLPYPARSDSDAVTYLKGVTPLLEIAQRTIPLKPTPPRTDGSLMLPVISAASPHISSQTAHIFSQSVSQEGPGESRQPGPARPARSAPRSIRRLGGGCCPPPTSQIGGHVTAPRPGNAGFEPESPASRIVDHHTMIARSKLRGPGKESSFCPFALVEICNRCLGCRKERSHHSPPIFLLVQRPPAVHRPISLFKIAKSIIFRSIGSKLRGEIANLAAKTGRWKYPYRRNQSKQ